jgi:hypothetical protein
MNLEEHLKEEKPVESLKKVNRIDDDNSSIGISTYLAIRLEHSTTHLILVCTALTARFVIIDGCCFSFRK